MINYGFKKLNLRRIISTTISKELDKLICKVLKFKSEGVMKKKFLKIINTTIFIFPAYLKEIK